MQKNCDLRMTILNCWYGTTENWQISWGVSFHTNTSTSVAVTNASTIVCFIKDMQLFNVTLHQNSKHDSLRLGLTFQIENLLSCRRVWKVDWWNIYIITISQDLCTVVTVNKHIIIDQKVTAFWKNFHFWQWAIEYSAVSAVLILTSLTWYIILYFLLPFHCSPSFNFQALFLLLWFKHRGQFSYIQCSFLIVLLF